ncbi:taste receptor type 2 member 39-like [Mantella aurantiaca]
MNLEGDGENHWSYIIVLALEIFIGTMINAFIISITLYDFGKAKTMSSVYKILLCLGISNLLFDILMSVGFVDYFYTLSVFAMTDVVYIFLYLMLFCVSSCAWHAATLGFFYFIKVADVRFNIFAWMKRKIGVIVQWMLMLGVLVSLLSSSFLISSMEISSNSTDQNPSFVSALARSMSSLITASIIVTISPLLVILICTSCTIVFLRKHGHRMKDLQTSDGERLKSFEKVVSRMTCTLLFYVISYVVMVSLYFAIVTRMESVFWLSLVMLSSFSPLQASLLVFANPRLMAALKEMLVCVHL